MTLIELALTNYTITPSVISYTDGAIRTINEKTIFCDLSGTSLTNNDFTLVLTLTNSTNNVHKFDVIFRNNLNDPKISTLIINNKNTSIVFNDRDESGLNYKMNVQEFILKYNTSLGNYYAISSIRKYQ